MTAEVITTIGMSIYLFFGVVILWKANSMVIEKKKIAIFLPFLFAGTVFCFRTPFINYELLNSWLGLILDYISTIAIFWILLLVRREKCFR